MQCAFPIPHGLSHLLNAFQAELDEHPDFKAAVTGEPTTNKKKRKAHVLEATTFTATISKPSRPVRYADSTEEEERDDGHEGEDSDNYSDEEMVYEPPRNKRPPWTI